MVVAQNETACVIEEDPDCPYSMWNLYFPRESKTKFILFKLVVIECCLTGFKEQSDTHQLIEKLISFIESLKNEFDIVKTNQSLSILSLNLLILNRTR